MVVLGVWKELLQDYVEFDSYETSSYVGIRPMWYTNIRYGYCQSNYDSHSRLQASSRLTAHSYTKSGIYHYSNEGVTSWYDFTKMIAEIAGHTDCDIQLCYSSEYPSPVKRSAYSVLDKKTFKETFNVKVSYWVDSLEVCIANLKKKLIT